MLRETRYKPSSPSRLGRPAILDVTLITAYFAFVNRIADGLGVELEQWYK